MSSFESVEEMRSVYFYNTIITNSANTSLPVINLTHVLVSALGDIYLSLTLDENNEIVDISKHDRNMYESGEKKLIVFFDSIEKVAKFQRSDLVRQLSQEQLNAFHNKIDQFVINNKLEDGYGSDYFLKIYGSHFNDKNSNSNNNINCISPKNYVSKFDQQIGIMKMNPSAPIKKR